MILVTPLNMVLKTLIHKDWSVGNTLASLFHFAYIFLVNIEDVL